MTITITNEPRRDVLDILGLSPDLPWRAIATGGDRYHFYSYTGHGLTPEASLEKLLTLIDAD